MENAITQASDALEAALAAITDEQLAAMDHASLQAVQWKLDELIQKLLPAKQRVHDARELQDLANRPPASPNPQVISFGGRAALPLVTSEQMDSLVNRLGLDKVKAALDRLTGGKQ